MATVTWLTYVRERFPLGVHLILVGGLAATGVAVSTVWRWPAFIISFLSLFVFFFQLRLMDELKDEHKDRIAHPRRPLPRGLLKSGQVRRLIFRLQILLFSFAALLAISPEYRLGGALFASLAAYLWLMYREFYVGERLSKWPFLYAFTHQILLLPLIAYPAALAHVPSFSRIETWLAGSIIFGAFFAYEICRKLDPRAHPVLRTYLASHGPIVVCTAVTVLALVSTYGAVRLGLLLGVASNGSLIALSWGLLMVNRQLYKWVEMAATLNLVVQIWVLPLSLALAAFNER